MKSTTDDVVEERYKYCPMKLAKTIICCLAKEKELWERFSANLEGRKCDEPMDVGQSSSTICPVVETTEDGTARRALKLASLVTQVKGRVDLVQEVWIQAKTCWTDYKHDFFMIQEEIRQNNDIEVHNELEIHARNLQEKMVSSQKDMLNNLDAAEVLVEELFPLLDEEIVQWKQEQKLHFLQLDKEPVELLEKLGKLCADLGECLYNLIDVCNKCGRQKLWTEAPPDIADGINHVNSTKSRLQEKFKKLIVRSFVVTVQPHANLLVTKGKTSPWFPSCVRILALESLQHNVSVPISAELRSQTELNGFPSVIATTLQLANGDGSLETERDPSKRVICKFDLQVRQFKRSKRTTVKLPSGPVQLPVCDQKFRLVFRGKFSLTDFVNDVELKVVSLPLTITSNTSQDMDCTAAQLWECWNTSPDNNDGPYEMPELVPWPRVADMLNKKFTAETGKGLPKDQLNYLASRMLGTKPGAKDVIFDELEIPRVKFDKDNMKDCEFTFWRWFVATMNLFKYYLNEEWKDGIIYGFISRLGADKVLRSSKPGVFLLRVSEKTLVEEGKHITATIAPAVVVVVQKNNKTKKTFEHIKPFKVEELEKCGGLHRALNELQGFGGKHLYPRGLPVQKAFRKYSKLKEAEDGRKGGKDGYDDRIIQHTLLKTGLDLDEDSSDDDDDIGAADTENSRSLSVSVKGLYIGDSNESSMLSTGLNNGDGNESSMLSTGPNIGDGNESSMLITGPNIGDDNDSSMLSTGPNIGDGNGSRMLSAGPNIGDSNKSNVPNLVFNFGLSNGSESLDASGRGEISGVPRAGPIVCGSPGHVQVKSTRPILSELVRKPPFTNLEDIDLDLDSQLQLTPELMENLINTLDAQSVNEILDFFPHV